MAEAFSGMHDILLGYDTDIHFENGDIMLTTGIDYIEREIYKLLITEPGDWKASPGIGASPNQLIGAVNTRENAIKMQDIITTGLRGTVYPATLDVRVIPTNYDSLMIFIDVYVRSEDILTIPFEFDYINGFRKINKSDSRVTQPKSTQEYKINDISKVKRPNKYWSRVREDMLSI
jgi:hypothetical protein